MNNLKKAFSLVELSIVILIIGILVSAIVTGSSVLSNIRLVAAKSLTKSSPVSSTKGLVLWLDAATNDGFLESEKEYDSSISSWKSINPTIADKDQIIFTQTNPEFMPKYVKKGINNLPSLYFDGGSTTALDGDILVTQDPAQQIYSTNDGITIFFVAKSDLDNSRSSFLFDFGLFAPQGYGIIFNKAGFLCYAVNFISNIAYKVSNPKNFSCRIAFNKEISTRQNGEFLNQTNNFNVSKITDVEIYESYKMVIGRTAKHDLAINRYFKGYIGELIIFDRALSEKELISIHGYLEQKWR